jgi:hypothetical protein
MYVSIPAVQGIRMDRYMLSFNYVILLSPLDPQAQMTDQKAVEMFAIH